jgi:hypothetical protein
MPIDTDLVELVELLLDLLDVLDALPRVVVPRQLCVLLC